MLDIFKRPVVIVIILLGIAVALVWSYIGNVSQQKKTAESTDEIASSITDLTTADPADFDEVVKREMATADAKASEESPSFKIAAIDIALPSLEINGGETRYVYSEGDSSRDNWTITFSQATNSFLRARIPKDDYLGNLPVINTNLWKFNYVTAIQIFEKNGGLDWRNNNGLSSVNITLKHGGKNNWLVWNVVYRSGDASLNKMIDANSGKIIEE